MTRSIVIPAEPEALPIDVDRTAVMVVDMQNSFCKKGGMMDYAGKLVVPLASRVIAACQNIITTARNHKIRVCYLRMTYGLEVDVNLGPDSPFYWKEKGLEAMREDPDLKGSFLTAGGQDWQIVDELQPGPDDIIIDKSRYSGFVNTDLDARLQSDNIKYLMFTGLYTNICVESTLRDAFFREYFPVLVKDACGHMGPEYIQDATIWNVKSGFGWLSTTGDLINALQ